MDLLVKHDSLPFINEAVQPFSSIHYERCEQRDALAFLPSDATVLELGARVGVVSCMINKILSDPTRHVCVEPDRKVIPALTFNRDTRDCRFSIFNGAVSKQRLYFNAASLGSFTENASTAIEKGRQGAEEIKTVTLEQLENIYKLKFDVLVADCEGAFEQFAKENDLSSFRMVLLEEDEWVRCNYDKCYELLKSYGFTVLHKYFDACNRSVHVNTSTLPFDLLYHESSFPVGLFGKSGYVTQEYREYDRNTISCHAPSKLLIKAKKDVTITPILLPSALDPKKITFYIDGKEVALNQASSLSEGVYELTVEAPDNTWAHTAWSVKE
ncbi:Putative methyltransferase [Cedratvirus A11]|uniref:Putative methyltransferase n=1 Tax=Cedratvirus A11 TaxID=1903266 RepID=A0A1M7XUU8_9VIRU|nr:Putative methyltransferase [Cedratvirus A11]SHO33452.1 Putative methyltransferase [Cedratvirus A11]